MPSAYTQANEIAENGQAFGALLWPVIEASGLPNRAAMRLQFEITLDQIADERAGSVEANTVWAAFAMKAIPMVELDGPSRVIINRKAESALDTLIDALLADQRENAAADRADYLNDMAREVA